MKTEISKTGYIPIHNTNLAQAKEYQEALSDFLCWIDGFKAAGGTYSPGSHERLRELNAKLKDTLP